MSHCHSTSCESLVKIGPVTATKDERLSMPEPTYAGKQLAPCRYTAPGMTLWDRRVGVKGKVLPYRTRYSTVALVRPMSTMYVWRGIT